MPKKSKKNDAVDRDWYIVDASDFVLGRLATTVANKLRGKHKTSFVPFRDVGDWVIVVNASKIQTTGNKLETKVYYRHSGFPGGIKSRTLGKKLEMFPEDVIRDAIRGMLPDNKLRKSTLRRLKVFSGSNHNFSDKKLIKL